MNEYEKHLKRQNEALEHNIKCLCEHMEEREIDLAVEHIALQNKINTLEQQLEASQKLSEERRLTLERCNPWEDMEFGVACVCCGGYVSEESEVEHKSDCDYVRLIKKEE